MVRLIIKGKEKEGEKGSESVFKNWFIRNDDF